MAKSSKLETEKRIFTIQGWILNGVPDYLILKQCVTEWNIGERQAKNLKERAYKVWHENSKIEVEHKRQMKIDELKQAKRNMKDIYKGTPIGMRVLLQYDKEINKLEGIIPDRKMVVKGDTENPIVFTNLDDAQKREARIEELIKKAMGK